MKQASNTDTPSPGMAIGLPDVLRAVQDDRARGLVIRSYKLSGYTLDEFATKRKAREAMCDALTDAEDWLELNAPSSKCRVELRDIRRRLEATLWT